MAGGTGTVVESEAGEGHPARGEQGVVSWNRKDLAAVSGLILLTTVTFWFFVPRGMCPDDEGASLYPTLLVREGKWPHLDYHEPYTGGRSWYQALLSRAVGLQVVPLRWGLLGFDLLIVGGLYFLARRMGLSAVWSLILGAIEVGWRFPLNNETFCSHYVLAFWILGVTLLAGGTGAFVAPGAGWGYWFRWLLAGLCGALAFSFKQNMGVYYAFGSFLAWSYFHPASLAVRARWGLVFLRLVGYGVIVLTIFSLIRTHLGPENFLVLGFPILVVVGICLRRDLTPTGLEGPAPWGPGIACLLGYLLPVAGLVMVYVARGGGGAWWHGVFVRPRMIVANAYFPLRIPGGEWVLAAFLFLLPAAWAAMGTRSRIGRLLPPAAWGAVLVSMILLRKTGTALFFEATWQFVTLLPPLAFFWFLVRRQNHGRTVTLVWLFTPLLYFTMYPTSYDVYLAYALPLGWLLYFYLCHRMLARSGRGARWFLAAQCLLALIPYGFLAKRTLETNTTSADNPVFRGLLLPETYVRQIAQVVAEVERRTTPGEKIYVYPESPELFLWTGRSSFSPHIANGTLISNEELQQDLEQIRRRAVPLILYHYSRSCPAEQRALFEAFLSHFYRRERRVGEYDIYGMIPSRPAD